MKRKLHHALDWGLSIIGIVTIFGTVMMSHTISLQVHILWTVVGLMLTLAGIWGVAVRFIPNERRFNRLREEGDRMIELIRQLNAAAVARKLGMEDGSRFDETFKEMQLSLHLMAEFAALEDGKDAQESPAVHPVSKEVEKESIAKIA